MINININLNILLYYKKYPIILRQLLYKIYIYLNIINYINKSRYFGKDYSNSRLNY